MCFYDGLEIDGRSFASPESSDRALGKARAGGTDMHKRQRDFTLNSACHGSQLGKGHRGARTTSRFGPIPEMAGKELMFVLSTLHPRFPSHRWAPTQGPHIASASKPAPKQGWLSI